MGSEKNKLIQKIIAMTVAELKRDFAKEYPELVGKGLRLDVAFPKQRRDTDIGGILSVDEDGMVDPSTHHLSFTRPFIFDIRKLPETFRGYNVEPFVWQSNLPDEFRADEYELMSFDKCWSEEHILNYALEHALEICEQLNDYSLTQKDICDKIAFGDFERHKENIRIERLDRMNDYDEDEEDL